MQTKFCFNEYMKANRKSLGSDNYYGEERFDILPAITCKDGFRVSAQASEMHYCSPRHSGMDFYHQVELGFPTEEVHCWIPYAEDPENPTGTVYGYVPVELLNEVIDIHGGLAEVTSSEPT